MSISYKLCRLNASRLSRNVIRAAIITYHGRAYSVYRRKWLPPSLRKLSQGKVEKTNTAVPTSSPPSTGPSLKKSGSDKRFKLPSGVEHNRPGKAAFEVEVEVQEGEEVSKEEEGEEQQEVEVDVDVDADVTESDDTAVTSLQEQNGGEDADDDLELPPPMKPITEPILVATANGPSGSTIPSELPGKRVSILSCFFGEYSIVLSRILHVTALFYTVRQSIGTYDEDSRWRRDDHSRPLGDRTNRQRENGKSVHVTRTKLCIARSTTCIINRSSIRKIRKGIVSCEPRTENR